MRGFTLGVVTPGRIGEWGRCLFAAPADRTAVLLLNILDRLLDVWALVGGAWLAASNPQITQMTQIWKKQPVESA